MNKIFYKNILMILFVVLVDQITKYFAIKYQAFVANEGMMFGTFSNSSALIRLSLITSGSIIYFLFYCGLQYFLSDSLKNLKYGLSLLFGGGISNALDKLLLNFVVDFIPISFGKYYFYANVSDMFQFIGVLIILYHLFFCQDSIWFPDDKRGKILINQKEQLIFSFKFLLVSCLALLMISIFSFSYIEVEFSLFSITKKKEFILSLVMLSVVFSILIFLFGIYLSHQFYGPIYKLKNYIDNGNFQEDFILREKDQFKELEEIVEKIKSKNL